MIPSYYDVIVGGSVLDFVNSTVFTQFLALKCCISAYIWQKVVKKGTSNILKSSLVPTVQLI